ncbi:RNA polymerase sigma factor [Bordetella ansorpii]|uniref:RNA polymerase sigma factor n=1 Tax=Bordetella ansorpii TaxID=288768 RepID=A0A157S5W4_9BORD|nr:sigma-70 family RNA polymerase sigma factor [Bordetella ansorpii]SAI65810.1 RNA polymerase sigma factor [Bordetella ansorpii]
MRAPVRPSDPAPAGLRDCLVEHYASLHRRLARRLGCPDLARESLHEAWLRLGDSAASQALRCPQAYVYRVACNVALDQLRARRPLQALDDSEAARPEEVPDARPGPQALAELRSDLRAVADVIGRLSRRDQAVLAALQLEDMTREQVAGRYGLTLRTVDTAMRRARHGCAAFA